ncbi:hypothetical protein N752_09515 [Desulforamulus aquiferis]|nr:hypothetical protein N752_09515 [Desulforamulus aquiferis]
MKAAISAKSVPPDVQLLNTEKWIQTKFFG